MSRAHAVAQAVAAERLEGWRPFDEHIAALAALARGDVAFADYLATFRDRHPPPRSQRGRRLGLRPAAPYLIPGTTLLRNNFGAVSAEMLADLEYVATAGRMVLWLCRPAVGPEDDARRLDVRVLHRHLFGDVYSWAGEYRTTELRRGEQGFASRVHDRHGDDQGARRREGGGRRRRRATTTPDWPTNWPASTPTTTRSTRSARATDGPAPCCCTASPDAAADCSTSRWPAATSGTRRRGTACRCCVTAAPITGPSCRSWCGR